MNPPSGAALDRKLLGIGNVVAALPGVDASHDQELYPFGFQVIDPCLKVGLSPIPSGPGISPVPPATRTRLPVVIVQQPITVPIDVHMCQHPLDAQTVPQQIVRKICSSGDGVPAGPDRASKLFQPFRKSGKSG